MNPEEDDIERFEEQRELELLREYRDIVPMFAYVVETERRFYLANTVELNQREDGWVEVVLGDNRCCSHDSRYFGPISADDVVGRVVARIWPVTDISWL